MQAIARAKFLRTSPRKARLVIDAIRGKDADEALAILQFTPNYAARLIEKVVKSAIANAENNHHMDAENLRIAQAMVDGGPNILKRLRYAPMGRGYRMVKRMSHITIAVEEMEPKPEEKPKRRAPAARGAKPARRGGAAPAAAKAEPKKPAKPRKKAEKPETPEKPEGQAEAEGGE